jgi:BON domain
MTAGIAGAQFSTLAMASNDIDLEHRLASFLYQQHVPEGDGIRLNACSGVLVVSGELSSQHAKWLCIECCRRVAGVRKVIDELEVAPAIINYPGTAQIDAEPDRYSQGRRNTTDRSRKLRFNHVVATKAVAHGTVAGSQPSRLLAAA